MKTPKELAARFAYQFEGENRLGLCVSKGWFPLFSKVCEDVDALLGDDKQGFHWRQIKEKFGTGRFYWDLGRTKGPLHIVIQTPEGILFIVNDSSQKQSDAEQAALMKSIGALVRATEKQQLKPAPPVGRQARWTDWMAMYSPCALRTSRCGVKNLRAIWGCRSRLRMIFRTLLKP